jgi:hypothetical protein
MKIKSILLFLGSLLFLPTHAQQTDIASKLQQAYRILNWGSDFETAENLLSGIMESDVAEQSDTTKYIFYYCNAGLMDIKEVQSEAKADYIRKAISLREQSLGIHDSEYIDLLCALATELEDEAPDAAIPLYERAMVVGMYPFYLKTDDYAAKQVFGKAMWNLARIYEIKGYEDQLISLYRESFDLLSPNYKSDDASSYIDLYALASYYGKQNNYTDAINTIKEVLAYIETHEGHNNSNYIRTLPMLASFYTHNGDLQQAISQYEENIQLIYDTFGRYDENLDSNYGNLFATLLDAQQIDEADRLLDAINDYYNRANNHKGWLNILYGGVVRLEEQQQIDKANDLCDKIIENISTLSIEEQEIIASKKSLLCYKSNDIAGAVQWQEQAMKLAGELDRDTFLLALSNLAAVYRISGDLSKSLECYQHLKTLLEEADLEMYNIYGNTVSKIVGFYENNLSEAESLWRESITHIESKYNRQNATYATLINGLGVVILKTDRANEALNWFSKVQKIYEQLNKTADNDYATILHNMGRAYMLRKQYKQAKTYLEQAKNLQIQLSDRVFERTEQYLSELKSLMSK